MIITKLTGGLGNQMFQYAAGRCLAEKYQTALKLDISGYKDQRGITPRQYALGIFNIKKEFAVDNDVGYVIIFFNSNKVGKIFLKFYNLLPIKYRHYTKEPHFNFYPQFFNAGDNSYLDGYWQSEKYFKEIGEIIRQEFILKKEYFKLNADLLNLIKQTDSISLHIRRSDYITNKSANQTHGTCSIDYYKMAIERVVKQLRNPYLFIFSDDIQWVKDNLKTDLPTTYVSDGNYKDYEELILMSYCKHNIIANSSFSWWGAWLNLNPDKMVVAPKNWFIDKRYNTTDLIPENWIKI